jgi:hypothetical protein
MPDITLISAGFSALNSAIQITKTAVGLRDSIMIQQEVGKLLPIINDAQKEALASYQRELALVKRVEELEAEVKRLKDWEAEKQRYGPKTIATGVVAYALKDRMQGVEGEHCLCPNCFENGKKQYLQERRSPQSRRTLLACTGCGAELDVTFGRAKA